MVSYLFIINVVLVFGIHLQYCKVVGFLEISLTNAEEIKMNSSFVDFSKLRVKKVNRTHVLIGQGTFLKEISNDVQCKILLYKKQGGEYRLTQFKLPVKGFCDFYNTDSYIVPDLQKVCPQCPKQIEKQCPWKAQAYYIDGLQLTSRSIPPFFDGEFMGQLQYLKDEVLLGGYSVYATVFR